MKTLAAVIAILRPHNMLATTACVVSAYYVSGGVRPGEVFLPALFTALVTGLGNLINDYYDADIDRINKPQRPIPSGRLAPRDVWRIYWVCTLGVTALMARCLAANLFVFMVAWQTLLFVYARSGKKMHVLGNFMVSGIVASSFFVGAMITGDYGRVAFPVAIAFVLVMGRELVKGAEDVEGDRAAGASTLAVRLGVERSIAWGVGALCLCAMLAPLPGLLRYFGRPYVAIVEFAFVPGILTAAALAIRHPIKPVLHRASWILKVEMFFGIVAIALGRV